MNVIPSSYSWLSTMSMLKLFSLSTRPSVTKWEYSGKCTWEAAVNQVYDILSQMLLGLPRDSVLKCHSEWSWVEVGIELVNKVGLHTGKENIMHFYFRIPMSQWFLTLNMRLIQEKEENTEALFKFVKTLSTPQRFKGNCPGTVLLYSYLGFFSDRPNISCPLMRRKECAQ